MINCKVVFDDTGATTSVPWDEFCGAMITVMEKPEFAEHLAARLNIAWSSGRIGDLTEHEVKAMGAVMQLALEACQSV